jgi:hypothetical protein
MKLLTPHQQSMVDRDTKVYDMYTKLLHQNTRKTAAMDAVRAKYGIFTYNTIYNIIKREEKRRNLV